MLHEVCFPSTAEVFEARREAGFVSPVAPLEPGRPMLVFETRGNLEWLMHPVDARRALAEGVVVDGVRRVCEFLAELPLMNAVQVMAKRPDVGVEFVDAVAA